MDVSGLLREITADSQDSKFLIGGVAASSAISRLVKHWNGQEVTVDDMQSNLKQTICELVNLSLRLDIVKEQDLSSLPSYKEQVYKSTEIVARISNP